MSKDLNDFDFEIVRCAHQSEQDVPTCMKITHIATRYSVMFNIHQNGLIKEKVEKLRAHVETMARKLDV